MSEESFYLDATYINEGAFRMNLLKHKLLVF